MKTNNTLKGFYTSEDEQGSFYSISVRDRGNKRLAANIISSLLDRHNARTLVLASDPFNIRKDISRQRGWRECRRFVAALTATRPIILIAEDRVNHKIVVTAKSMGMRRCQLADDRNKYIFE